MLKILFYHCNDTIGIADIKDHIFLGIAALYLKTYIDKTRPDIAERLEWLVPIQKKMSDDELIAYINLVKPDIFCTSNYIWNHSFIMSQIERVKSKLDPNVKIISGGPSIDVNIDPDFFTKYPFIDFAIYGAGETAFLDIIESIIFNKKLISFNTSNVAWFDKNKNKQVVAEFKYVPQLKWSPFLSNEEYFSQIIKAEQDKGVSVIVPYDLTRGCPYSCTFCDWNSGLTNKTTRRKGTYIDEIDLFQKLKVKNLYLSDANVGQYDEDIDMIEYLAKKNIEENAGFKIDGNFSKLRKENNLKIYRLMGHGRLNTEYAGFTISVQDINTDVLKNIDRPDVGWDVHKSMIRELKESFPNTNSKVQLIQGLPGQTLESWKKTLIEISKEDCQLQIFTNELLPASPAARDKNYQEKFKFSYSQSLRYNNVHYFNGHFAESCFSFSKEEFVDMTIISIFFTAITTVRAQWHETYDCEKIVDYFLRSSTYQRLRENLYDNWTKNDKFYFTINFDGYNQDITACNIIAAGGCWKSSLQLLRMIIAANYEKSLQKEIFYRYINKENKSFVNKIRNWEGYALCFS